MWRGGDGDNDCGEGMVMMIVERGDGDNDCGEGVMVIMIVERG